MITDLETPWVEKYRPNSFDEIVSQSIAINNIKSFVSSGNMPHMIFSGPAGTGKTSTALIIAKALLKGEDYARNVLELNASDTRRLKYMRDVLKVFTTQSSFIGENQLKIVILDEADNLRTDAQQALRRIIEKTSSHVKFIILCNYINRIIDPIISRCAVFRFVELPEDKIIERLDYISKKEGINIVKEKEEGFFKTLYFISGGDLRKAINTLQMSVALELIENVNLNEILKISGFLEDKTCDSLLKALNKGDLTQAITIIRETEFFDSHNFLRQLIGLLFKLNIPSNKLIHIYALIGDIDFRISQGADELIQISAILAEIIHQITPSRDQ
ncbi:MAG: replication factor C small subunit [Promethearchaeota archaeon]